jgi:predicted nucleic acid-binding protein
MGSSSVLIDPAVPLIADASTVINLVATSSAAQIVAALPNRILVVDHVPAELETGRARGRPACDGLRALVADKLVEIVALPDAGELHYESLVIGQAAETLDDGEAATIACALALGATALIDERKATRICGERFPHLGVACTVDILFHPQVAQGLGAETLGDAVFRALRDGKMGVLPQHLDAVVAAIGPERAALCSSLPSRVRAGHRRG